MVYRITWFNLLRMIREKVKEECADVPEGAKIRLISRDTEELVDGSQLYIGIEIDRETNR